MSNNVKSLWITRTKTNTTGKGNPFLVDDCAICRGDLTRLCLECDLHRPREAVEEKPERLLMTLLMLQRRDDTLFSTLDRNIISLIYDYACVGPQIQEVCNLVQLSCEHIFHEHCILKWFRKRPNCPLCNTRITDFSENCKFFLTPHYVFKSEIISVIQSDRSYLELVHDNLQQRPDYFQVTNNIIQILHAKGFGCSKSYLESKFRYSTDLELYLQDMIWQGTITFEEETQTYHY